MIQAFVNTNQPVLIPTTAPKQILLSELKPGQAARIIGFESLPGPQLAALQAYGILPGHDLVVLQQNPLTIVQVEWTELAFEAGIARRVLVEPIDIQA